MDIGGLDSMCSGKYGRHKAALVFLSMWDPDDEATIRFCEEFPGDLPCLLEEVVRLGREVLCPKPEPKPKPGGKADVQRSRRDAEA
jgi:hypothetical protein